MRRVVVISGAPGAGKSTLAAPLAEILGLPLISKDTIKECLHDSLAAAAPDDALAWSRMLGAAAMELLWALAARFPAAVVEANFRPHSAYELAKLRDLGAVIVEVNCHCAPAEAARRYEQRARAGERRQTHVVAMLSDSDLAQFDRPMGVGRQIAVDTTTAVDIPVLAAEIARAFNLEHGRVQALEPTLQTP